MAKGQVMWGGVVECPDCNGTGYDPLDGGQCDRCGGLGEIPAEDDD